MKKNRELFPQKIALGDCFCNRAKEQEILKKQITAIRPTLIISPRRYGKTSLGIYVLNNLKLSYAHLDLFPLVSTGNIENIILGGIGEILASMENTPQKAFKAISEFFGELSISFNVIKAKIEVTFIKAQNRPNTLLNALKGLDETLQKRKRRAVLFLDEFQRLGQMPDSEQIEGAIRHVAQQSKNLIFIFSGSNRHLLGKMFDERHRPLYKLCDRITLDRISVNDYIPFLQRQSTLMWKKQLDEDSLESIFECTEQHPYYVNALCYRLWNRKAIFTRNDVYETWDDYSLGEKSTVFRELESLSANQLKLLISLARFGESDSLLADKFLSFAGMPASSANQSLRVLQEKDYIYKNKQGSYQVLDPLIKWILANRS